MKTTKSDRWAMTLFLIPAVALVFMFFVIPVCYVAVISLTKWGGIGSPEFVGFKNFATLFKDKVFIRAVTNNIIWSLVASCVQVPLAMIMAIILSRKIKGWRFFRTVYFFPQVISGVALATLWRAIYKADTGLLNAFLRAVGVGNLACDWLGQVATAFPAVLIYWVFYIGYYMVIIMADITTINQSYYEASTIDGASGFQQAIYITIPLIKRTSVLTCVTLAAVMGLRQFEQVYMLTNGQPANTTVTMVLYLYNKMSNRSYGMSSAAAVVLIIVGALFISMITKLFRERKTKGVR